MASMFIFHRIIRETLQIKAQSSMPLINHFIGRIQFSNFLQNLLFNQEHIEWRQNVKS